MTDTTTASRASQTSDSTLKERMISGGLWTTAARILTQALQFGGSVVLAHLLHPRDYGIIGIVLVATGFAGVFTDFGIGLAIIQRRDLNASHLDTGFAINLLVALVLTIVMFVFSPAIAAFYHVPNAVLVLRVNSFIFALSALGTVPLALLQRRMLFRLQALILITSSVASTCVAVALAFAGAGVWALTALYLIGAGTTSALSLLATRWRPGLQFSRVALGQLWRFTSNFTGFNVINYWARNGDNLLIGKYFGPVGLGLYMRAYGLMLIPISQVINSISGVLFSGLASVQDDKLRVQSVYLRAVGIVTLISFPLMVGLIVSAHPFILALFGPRWAPVAPLIQVMAFAGMIQTLTNPVGSLYGTQGRTDIMLRIGIVTSVTYIISFVVGILIGSIMALAITYTAANFVLLYPTLAIPYHLVGLRVRDALLRAAGPALASTLMAMIMVLAQRLQPASFLPWQALALQTGVGGVTYVAVVALLRLTAVRDLVDVVRVRFLPQGSLHGRLVRKVAGWGDY
jgi:O-antigen/teichoic acid export membrane protein